MQTSNLSRVQSWDFIKFIAIFLVIWGHCIRGILPEGYVESPIYRFIYSFHMPLFMMISGYFSFSSMGMNIRDFLTKKFIRLIYPCIIWGGILWLFLEVIYSFHYGNSEYSFCGLLTDLYWLSDFWFLKSCFICYLIAFVGVRSKLKYWMLATLFVSQTVSPFFVSFMYPCFLIGYLLKANVFLFESIKKITFLLSFLFILMLLFWDKNMWIRSHGIPPGFLMSDMRNLLILVFCRLYRLIIGIVGSLAVISSFLRFFSIIAKSNFIVMCSKWGKYTLNVYLLQRIILEYGISHFLRVDIMPPFYLNFFIIPIISILVLFVCVYITELIKLSPRLEIILWGTRNPVRGKYNVKQTNTRNDKTANRIY